jgi:3D (Asp-Asp-Asp) domain-containing protein
VSVLTSSPFPTPTSRWQRGRRALLACGVVLTTLGIGVTAAAASGGPNSIAAFGDAAHQNSIGSASRAPIVGVTATPTGRGYWLVARDGGVFGFGDARYHGSAADLPLISPIVGIAATPSGGGYWLVASDGGVFSFGDAVYRGSPVAVTLSKPIVAVTATRTGRGYWLVAGDGGVFSFGDAVYRGSAGAVAHSGPITGMATSHSGKGYWLVSSDGGVFSFGDAAYRGGLAGHRLVAPVVGITATAAGHGYWMATADGGVFAFGDARYHGSLGAAAPGAPVVGLQATPTGAGYWLVTGRPAPPAPSTIDLGSFSLTCYSLPGATSSGLPVSEQTVAVDPGLIPLGTRLLIPGLGQTSARIAADTGTAIRGKRIDVWMASYAACLRFGRHDMQVLRLV